MLMEHYIKIISFVGLTGSGKSSAAQYLADRGYPKVVMGFCDDGC